MTDQLIVTKLRPMSECEEGCLVLDRSSMNFEVCKEINESGEIRTSESDIYFSSKEFYLGWIPMPSYQPEKP